MAKIYPLPVRLFIQGLKGLGLSPIGKKKIRLSLSSVILLLILALAIVLRFYKFNQRWAIDFDPARDILVARAALDLKKIPLIGSFSSAGPFVFGPLFYWFIMLSYFLTPGFIAAPFLLYTLLDVLFVYIMAKIGQQLWQKQGLLVLGLIAAVSTAQISRASNVNQPTLIPFFNSLMILFLLNYLKKRRYLYVFLAGLSLGLGLNMHFQALNLGAFVLLLLLAEKNNWKKIIFSNLVFLIGIIIPLLPLFYWDYTQGWKNILNVLDYFLIAQYRIYVPNRWLTYLGQYWPQVWSNVFGGQPMLGYIFMALVPLVLIYQIIKKKLNKSIFGLAVVFLIMFIVNRYYRGVRFEGYMLYFYPLVMIFSAFVIINIDKIKVRFVSPGLIFLTIALILTLKADYDLIFKFQLRDNTPKQVIQRAIEKIKQQKPKKKFIVFDDRYQNPAPAITTSAFLYFENLIDEKNGDILGFSTEKQFDYPKLTTIEDIAETVYVYDLTNVWQKKGFEKKGWINVSPEYVCLDNLEWWKVKEFKSSFSLSSFIKEKLGLKKVN